MTKSKRTIEHWIKHGGLFSSVFGVVRFVLFACMSFVLLYPLLYMISVAFRPVSDMYDPMVVWVPKTFTLDNMVDVFKKMDYPKALMNTVIIDFGSSIIQVFICSMAGYGFARFNFRFKKLLFAILMMIIIIPPQLITIPSYLNLKNFDFFGTGSLLGLFTGQPLTVNLLNNPLAFYIPAFFGAGIRSSLFIFIFRQFFRGLPKELEQSAYVDGSGPFRTYFQIMFPNAVTAVITVLLFSIVWYWNDFYYVSMYFSTTRTVTTALYNIRATLVTDSGLSIEDPIGFATRIQAACLYVVGPILILYIVLQRYFTESIERTGIVG